ncbi:hypothetical protein [Blastochloris tepida]|uniref:Uncharacterized protein n=1 Tax=Blastochloris tepida TaxID=2233851 RepID=A0A348FZV1_9HYPH|nr:hypothetical protein [Blastochloris tepida]BBF92834.1 hypothetical protein BLTE_15190 [Blastochloris tepida]
MKSKTIGRSIRIPLDHPEIDAIDLRMHVLAATGELNDAELGMLIKLWRNARRADKFLGRALLGGALPETSVRPMFWDAAAQYECSQIECAAGFVLRVREWVEKLERKYGLPADVDQI